MYFSGLKYVSLTASDAAKFSQLLGESLVSNISSPSASVKRSDKGKKSSKKVKTPANGKMEQIDDDDNDEVGDKKSRGKRTEKETNPVAEATPKSVKKRKTTKT